MSKKILIAGIAALAVTLTAGATVSNAFAQESSRVQEFSERFNLDQSEVEQYFEEKRAEKQQMKQERKSQKLDALVENGTLTQEQREALEAKLIEHHEEVRALHEELKTWAEENGIDLIAIKGHKGGHGHKAGFGTIPTSTN